MEMANASGNFGNALVGLRAWNDAIHDFRISGWLAIWLAEKMAGWLAIWLAGWLSSWLAIWLTRWLRWLAGYLAIGFVAAWLAIWLLAIWLAGWLIGRLALAIWLAL